MNLDAFDFAAIWWWRILVLNICVFILFVLLSAWNVVNGAMDKGMTPYEAVFDEPRKLTEAFVALVAVCLIPYVQVAILAITSSTLVVVIYLICRQQKTSLRKTMQKGKRILLDIIDEAGLKILYVEYVGTGHIRAKVLAVDGATLLVVFPATASDWRGRHNKLADLKRFAKEHGAWVDASCSKQERKKKLKL